MGRASVAEAGGIGGGSISTFPRIHMHPGVISETQWLGPNLFLAQFGIMMTFRD